MILNLDYDTIFKSHINSLKNVSFSHVKNDENYIVVSEKILDLPSLEENKKRFMQLVWVDENTSKIVAEYKTLSKASDKVAHLKKLCNVAKFTDLVSAQLET